MSTRLPTAVSTPELWNNPMHSRSMSKLSVTVGTMVVCTAVSGCFDPLIEDPGAGGQHALTPPGIATGTGTPAPGLVPVTPGVSNPPAPVTPPASATDPVSGTPPVTPSVTPGTPPATPPVTPPTPPVTPPTPPANDDAGVPMSESSGDTSDADGGFDSTAPVSSDSTVTESSGTSADTADASAPSNGP